MEACFATHLYPFSPTHIFHLCHNNLTSLSKKFTKFLVCKGQLVSQPVCSCRCGGHHAYAHGLASCLLPMGSRVSFPLFLVGNSKFIFSLSSSLRTFRNTIVYETAPICDITGWETGELKACSHTAQYNKFLFHKNPLP